VKISVTIIEIPVLTFNKWSSEVYHFQKSCFLAYVPRSWLWSQHWRNCRISKTKTKWCL